MIVVEHSANKNDIVEKSMFYVFAMPSMKDGAKSEEARLEGKGKGKEKEKEKGEEESKKKTAAHRKLTLSVQRGLAGLVLGDFVDSVLAALLARAEGLAQLRHVHHSVKGKRGKV